MPYLDCVVDSAFCSILQTFTGQTIEAKIVTGIGQFKLGAQHEHRQTLQGSRQNVTAAHQQNIGRATLETDETGLHSTFGATKASQSGLGQAKQRKIVGELTVQKFGGILTLCANQPQMGQRGGAIEWVLHGTDYDASLILQKAIRLCVVFSGSSWCCCWPAVVLGFGGSTKV
ncbi:hypothetical protein GALL_430400 [mine drainage metagenome]|uniref:Uncharacterized protein n=1 Tax=mine drainage metagenome TaxID=410659 RepID=A0A1J5PW17_9ZZZZ